MLKRQALTTRQRLSLTVEQRKIFRAKFDDMRRILALFMSVEEDKDRRQRYTKLLTRAKTLQPTNETDAGEFFREANQLVSLTIANCKWRLAQMMQGCDKLNLKLKIKKSEDIVDDYLRMCKLVRQFTVDFQDKVDKYVATPTEFTEKILLDYMRKVGPLQTSLNEAAHRQIGRLTSLPPPSEPECRK